MSQNFVNPTYYNLQRAIITSEFSNIGELDVTALIPSISLTASIDSETIFGSARFVDSVGLLDGNENRDPLRGEEMIIFEIADSKMINENVGTDGEVQEPFRFFGYLYKIDNVSTKEVNDAVIYDVHFISYQSFIAGTKEIIRAFRDKKVSDIVQSIFKEYYDKPALKRMPKDSVKSLELENTEGMIRCTIPKMRPEEAMSFLSKRSYSINSPSCTFRFFESFNSYHFMTDEQILRLSEKDPSRVFNLTYIDSIPKTLDFFEAQRNNLEIIDNNKRFNSFDDLYNGTYKNKVYELDILSRKTNLLDESNQYNFLDEKDKYFINDRSERNFDKHTEAFINKLHDGTEDIQKEWLIVQNYSPTEKVGNNSMQAETHYADIVSNRQAYSKHISNITINASGVGRFDITVGDVINLTVKKFVFAGEESSSLEENERLSGSYIVRSITYKMEHEEMYNTYSLMKRSWNESSKFSSFDENNPRGF